MEHISEILQEKQGFPADIADVYKKQGLKAMGEYCEQKNIQQGKIYNENYGWEYPAVLERFGLNPNMKGVPAILDYTYEVSEGKEAERDEEGKRTGYYRKKLIKSHYKDWVITPEWLAYKKYKKEEREKWEKRRYAQNINTPPIEYWNE